VLYAPPAHARRARDHYSTPADLARALLSGLRQAGLELPSPIYDPCAGEAALLRALNLPGFGSDLYPDEYRSSLWILEEPIDATDVLALSAALIGGKTSPRSIVTNPPYGRTAVRIVEAALRLMDAGQVDLAAFLLPLPWEAAGTRLELMRRLSLRIVCSWRPEWIEGTGGGGKMSSVWLVWTQNPPRFPLTVYEGRP
jgi:hypothetical protein